MKDDRLDKNRGSMKRVMILVGAVAVGVFGSKTEAQVTTSTAAPPTAVVASPAPVRQKPITRKPPQTVGSGSGNVKSGDAKQWHKGPAEQRPIVNRPQLDLKTGHGSGQLGHRGGQGQGATPRPLSFAQALQHHGQHHHHDRSWWRSHYTTIVCVNRCYYYWFGGYWFPAFGYDPNYDNYEYDGPIYTYGNLLPDQVIYNVQRALQEQGYYQGKLTGSFGSATRQALIAFQNDVGLTPTGAIDADTVEALGLVGD